MLFKVIITIAFLSIYLPLGFIFYCIFFDERKFPKWVVRVGLMRLILETLYITMWAPIAGFCILRSIIYDIRSKH